MSKLVHITDAHLGGAYPEKAERSFDFLTEELWGNPESPAYMPDVVFSTGDLTDRPLHIHSEYLKPFLRFVKAADCPIVLLQGTYSHEPAGAINNLAAVSDGKILVIDSPLQAINVAGFTIQGMPGLSRPLLSKWCCDAGIPINGFDDPNEAAHELFSRMAKYWDRHPITGGIRVLGGHLTVSGAETSTGHTLTGNDIVVSLEDIALAGSAAVMLGHIHKHQIWTHNGIHISYGGSSHPTNWGELDPKGFSVYSFTESGVMSSFERVAYPHKGMVKVSLEFTGNKLDGDWEWQAPDMREGQLTNQAMILSAFSGLLTNKEVKCCYTIPREIAVSVDDAFVRLMFAKEGIELAAVERTIASQSRERIIDISSKETTRAQYEVTCQARNEEPRPGALEKADRIDETGVEV